MLGVCMCVSLNFSEPKRVIHAVWVESGWYVI